MAGENANLLQSQVLQWLTKLGENHLIGLLYHIGTKIKAIAPRIITIASAWVFIVRALPWHYHLIEEGVKSVTHPHQE